MSERYKLIIVGTRSFNDYEMLRDAVFTALLEQSRWTYGFSAEIVSGGAPGADTLAVRYATDDKWEARKDD